MNQLDRTDVQAIYYKAGAQGSGGLRKWAKRQPLNSDNPDLTKCLERDWESLRWEEPQATTCQEFFNKF